MTRMLPPDVPEDERVISTSWWGPGYWDSDADDSTDDDDDPNSSIVDENDIQLTVGSEDTNTNYDEADLNF